MNNLVAMSTYSNSTIYTSVLDSYYTYNDVFTQEDGLRFAFGIPHFEEHLADKIDLDIYLTKFDSDKRGDN